MGKRSWDELDAILDEALELPPEKRPVLLDRLQLDPSERERLEKLIAAAESDDDTLAAGGALGGRRGEQLAALLDDEEPPGAPDSIPGYRLLRRIGSGGMGHVWEADQIEPVRRRVAVKVIRPERDSDRVVARFESERQTLARMNHPGIAQIFDAGLTDSGRHFFTMEYVDGLPLAAFCDEHRLSIRQRLELFREVCDAVQHAHQKGVIHRDLKPSNVLVTRVHGRPVPKVIDFGIARLAEGVLDRESLLTEVGMVIGTPEYMSPEQASASPVDVDTRADVYALGVLLYELLTGALPFERPGSSPVALAGFFSELRETEPPRPSQRVGERGEKSLSAAVSRGTEPVGLARALRGDLDWIVMKALEKDRARRYDSVGELSADVGRHLSHEPVSAGPPGTVYRMGKLARRHRGLLAASAAVLVALLAGLAGTVTGLLRAREEAERARTQAAIAEAVNAFLNDDLLAAVAPGSQGRDVTMREVLDTAASGLEGRFPDQPQVEAAVRHTIGDTYVRLGRLDEASPHLERAVALRAEALGEDAPATLESVHALGELRFYQGRIEDADALLHRCFEGRERALGPNHPETLSALSDLGAVAQARGDLDDAEQHYRDAYGRASAALNEDDETLLAMEHNLGALLHERDHLDEAESWLRRALEGSRRVLGNDHPETLSTLSLLGSVLREAGRREEAAPIDEEVLATRRRVLGDEHPSTLISANNLAMLRSDLGQLREAEDLLRSTLAVQRRVLGEDHDAVILSLGNIGGIVTRDGRPAEAEPLYLEALERCRRTLGPDHALCGATLRGYARTLAALSRPAEAEARFREAHAVLAAAYGEDHPDVTALAEELEKLTGSPVGSRD
ncbi:MAG: serine/threonine-protein kinase [Acidobacteria bacterium]|nr:serine/threonine-protein kinase [Acidobacteriota bacterium]